jgi:hypothetical protein
MVSCVHPPILFLCLQAIGPLKKWHCTLQAASGFQKCLYDIFLQIFLVGGSEGVSMDLTVIGQCQRPGIALSRVARQHRDCPFELDQLPASWR